MLSIDSPRRRKPTQIFPITNDVRQTASLRRAANPNRNIRLGRIRWLEPMPSPTFFHFFSKKIALERLEELEHLERLDIAYALYILWHMHTTATYPAQFSHVSQALETVAVRCTTQLLAISADPANTDPDLFGKIQRNLNGILRSLALVEKRTPAKTTAKATPRPAKKTHHPKPTPQSPAPQIPAKSPPQKGNSPAPTPPVPGVPPPQPTSPSAAAPVVKKSRSTPTKGAFGQSKTRRLSKAERRLLKRAGQSP